MPPSSQALTAQEPAICPDVYTQYLDDLSDIWDQELLCWLAKTSMTKNKTFGPDGEACHHRCQKTNKKLKEYVTEANV